MATFTGTTNDDTIRPKEVSPGVISVPAGSKPSGDIADLINGGGGDDRLEGGGGGDTIFAGSGNDTVWHFSQYSSDQVNSGSTIHGGSGDDWLDLGLKDAGAAHVSQNALYGDDGNDIVGLVFDGASHPGGTDPRGPVYLYGGSGDDEVNVDAEALALTLATEYLFKE